MLLLDGRWRSATGLALCSVLLEEEAALVVAGLGLWLLLARRGRLGAGLFAAGAGLLFSATLLIMPGFHHPATLGAAGGNRSLNHFAELRTDPTVALRRLVGERGPDAVVSFLLPTAGTALLAPPLLVAALPTGAALFLQDRTDTFHRHWAAPILPLLWLAAAVGLAQMQRTRPDDRRPWSSSIPRPSAQVSLGLLAAGISAAYLLASPLPGGRNFDPAILAYGPHELDLDRAVAAVPPDAALAVSANVAAHVANRPEVYIYPIDDHYLSKLRFEERPIDGYVLDLQEPATLRVPPLKKSSPLLADPPYVLWSSGHKVMLLTRDYPAPSVPSGATFNRRITLIGYDLARSGERLDVTLYWQKTAGVFADFDRLAELVGRDGQIVEKDPNLSVTTVFTTEKWKVGQVVVDRFDLPLASGGPFTLRLTWFNRDRRTPLMVDGGGEALELPVALP